MADVSDEKITEAYEDVRSNKSDTNWLLLDYVGRTDKLSVTSTGTGGLAELKDALQDSNASYAYARIQYSNDKESQREKFVFIKWIGKGCKGLRRGKVSVQAADVKNVLTSFSLEHAAEDKAEIDEEALVIKLRKAGGASYDGV
ncbi:actin depolymerizing protein [Schizopora paradoxa]|uniref:Actin depolymerizing protein n=1 Tax=Schizopora paradoxa TaxID=27342 RepID=A0A0H2RQ58_9AGAM|nr:actin depolymerizing protein [Schizopora paradoxa]